jgi:hypothetical protein
MDKPKSGGFDSYPLAENVMLNKLIGIAKKYEIR